jgi:hypothetical protein
LSSYDKAQEDKTRQDKDKAQGDDLTLGPRARARTSRGGERRDKVEERQRDNTRRRERSGCGCGTHFLNLKRESGKIVKTALFSTILTTFP